SAAPRPTTVTIIAHASAAAWMWRGGPLILDGWGSEAAASARTPEPTRTTAPARQRSRAADPAPHDSCRRDASVHHRIRPPSAEASCPEPQLRTTKRPTARTFSTGKCTRIGVGDEYTATLWRKSFSFLLRTPNPIVPLVTRQ